MNATTEPRTFDRAESARDKLDAPHHRSEKQAIEAARDVLSSVMDYGPVPPLDISPDMMPLPELRTAHRLILDAVSDGANGWQDVFLHINQNASPPQLELIRARFMEITEARAFGSKPDMLAGSVRILQEHHRTRRRWELAAHIKNLADVGKTDPDALAALAALETGSVDKSLIDAAYDMRFDPSETPPEDESCMLIGDIPIAARGNLSAIQGKSKVGKSAVVAAILGAAQRANYSAQGDLLEISWDGDGQGAILHIDTEQSPADWHALVNRSVTRSGMPAVSTRLVSLPLVMFARSERLDILRQSMRREHKAQGSIDLVVIDGLADLCLSPNDEQESLELISQVHALAQEHDCAVFCILHENPGSEFGKTRGHLGSELNRKAFANLRLQKDQAGTTHVFGTDMRKREIPLDQAFCFSWCDESRMHVYRGRAAGLKAAEREAEQVVKERAYFTPLFESIGTNGTCPDSTPDEIRDAHRDTIGTNKLPSRESIKKRMQRAETIGVLRKTSRTNWSINLSGQSGQDRDK